MHARQPLALGLLASLALFGCDCGGAGGGADGGVDAGAGTGSDGGVNAVEINSNLETDTTWGPTPATCDVVVRKKQTLVKANLTILAGTVVCFEADTGLLVDKTGSLRATGTASSHIVFTGVASTPGSWQGLGFLSNNNANLLQYVDVRFAGSSETFCCGFFVGNETPRTSVVVGDYATSALLSIQHSTISQSGGGGVFAFEGSRLPGFTDNTFQGNAGAPVAVSLPAVNDLDAASSYSGGGTPNGKSVVRVLKYGKTTSPVVFRKLDVAYGMGEGLGGSVFTVAADLTFEAGVRLEFEANSGLVVEATGQLVATGTASERVVLTGRTATPGFWKGVAVLGLLNSLTQTSITYAGNDDALCCGFYEAGGGASTRAGLVVGDYATTAAALLTDVQITQSKNRGVSVIKGSLTQSGTNDLSTGNGQPNLL